MAVIWKKNGGLTPKQKHRFEMEDGVDYVPSRDCECCLWPSVCFHRRSRSDQRSDSGRHVRLASGSSVDSDRRRLLWSGSGFRCDVCVVKNKGRTIGYIIEEYIGKLGKKLFLLFCWLFCILVVAAFADVVAGTFNGFVTADGVTSTVEANGAVATTSMLFIIEAVALGMILKYGRLGRGPNTAIAIGMLVAAVGIGLCFPIYITRPTWHIIIFIYVLIASVAPVWSLLQPREAETDSHGRHQHSDCNGGIAPLPSLPYFKIIPSATASMINSMEVVATAPLASTVEVTPSAVTKPLKVPATTSANAATTRIQNSQQNSRNNFLPSLPMYSSII